jgi:transcriptional regulator with XRE-family HTH domain
MTTTFGGLLARHRRERSQSGRALAAAIGVSPSMLSMLESDDRRPSREQTLLIADKLGLSAAERDELLVTAGHLAGAFDRISPSDPDLLLLADILADEGIPEEDKEELRFTLRLVCRRWRQGTVDLAPLRDQLHPPTQRR